MHDLLLFLPEIVCLCAALLLFALSMLGLEYGALRRAALCGGVAAIGAALLTLHMTGEPFAPRIYRVDLFSQLVKTGLGVGLLGVLLLSRDSGGLSRWNRREFPLFLFCSTFGMMMLVSATEMLTFYVAMEFSAYPLYILAALNSRQQLNGEGVTKYFLQGAVSSAITLYGLSLLFGMSHSVYFADIAALSGSMGGQPLWMMGVLLVLCGLLFKLAAFPFHFWAPDVYTVASNQVVTFIATSSKLAAIAVLCRLTNLVQASPGKLTHIILLLSVVSMTLGNLAAIRQRDFKRMLAYSAIAHAGYAFVGLCTFTGLGMTSALFYGFIYLLMGLACFMVICLLGGEGEDVTIDSLAGLHQRSPVLALLLLVGLLGLAGVPPTAGFVGKWFLFAAALAKGHLALVLIAAINATIALYYYLQVLKVAYMHPPATDRPLTVALGSKAFALVLVAVITLLGIFPGLLWDLLEQATRAL
jgi:NADH-quinone oxidoreductase subunit N